MTFQWSAILSDMGLAGNCTKNLRCRIMAVLGKGHRLQVGMVLAIEPMVNVGGHHVRILDDQWTAVTQDGSLSAHFEHTISIQASGPPRILTAL